MVDWVTKWMKSWSYESINRRELTVFNLTLFESEKQGSKISLFGSSLNVRNCAWCSFMFLLNIQRACKGDIIQSFSAEEIEANSYTFVNTLHQLIVELELLPMSVLFLNFLLYHITLQASIVAETEIYWVCFKASIALEYRASSSRQEVGIEYNNRNDFVQLSVWVPPPVLPDMRLPVCFLVSGRWGRLLWPCSQILRQNCMTDDRFWLFYLQDSLLTQSPQTALWVSRHSYLDISLGLCFPKPTYESPLCPLYFLLDRDGWEAHCHYWQPSTTQHSCDCFLGKMDCMLWGDVCHIKRESWLIQITDCWKHWELVCWWHSLCHLT